MNQDTITRNVLSGIIRHYIAAIKVDPNRSIRQLVDFAERTAVGPTAKIIYQMMQDMGQNLSSPYYDLLHQMVIRNNPKSLEQFGLNLGYTTWMVGSREMRRLMWKSDFSIPWTVLIDRGPAADRIPFETAAALTAQGNQVGVHTWMFRYADALDEWDSLAEIFRAYPENAFALFVDSGAFADIPLDEAAEFHNLMILLDTDGPDWQENAEKLADCQMLYSVFRTVSTPEQAEDILSGSWFEELVVSHPIFAFTLTADDCPPETAEAVSRCMWDTRLGQLYPVMPSDLISDFLVISKLVTHEETLVRVDPDGSVFKAKGFFFEPSGLKADDLFKEALDKAASAKS